MVDTVKHLGWSALAQIAGIQYHLAALTGLAMLDPDANDTLQNELHHLADRIGRRLPNRDTAIDASEHDRHRWNANAFENDGDDDAALAGDPFANNNFLFDDDTRPSSLREIPGYAGDSFPQAKADMLVDSDAWSNQYLGSGGPERVLVASVVNPSLKKYEGKTAAQMGAEEKKDPRDALIDLVIADRANTACIIFMMDEKDVRTALASPLVAFCTDSGSDWSRKREAAASAGVRGARSSWLSIAMKVSLAAF